MQYRAAFASAESRAVYGSLARTGESGKVVAIILLQLNINAEDLGFFATHQQGLHVMWQAGDPAQGSTLEMDPMRWEDLAASHKLPSSS